MTTHDVAAAMTNRTLLMLSLTDTQLKTVMNAAELLPRSGRDNFLRSISSRLDDVERPSDHQLAEAIAFILASRGVATGRGALRPHHQEQTNAHSR